MNDLTKLFLLDPDVIFLNHGSFGATPRPVFEVYQNIQRQLEQQPVAFLGREYASRMQEARTVLANYLDTDPDHIVFVTNATTAVNMIARSLQLGPGDEVLASDHEYGALDRMWRFLASRQGFAYKHQPIPLPITCGSQVVEELWKGVTPSTRVIFISHITSPTAVIFPVAEICRKAHEFDILTIVDGAHAPGQISLSMRQVEADFYVGNLHKWLCAPKGSAFLYAHPDRQSLLSPLIVSWGWESEKPSSSPFIDQHEWQGTRDPSAFLSVPAAIRFQSEHDWDQVRLTCHRLAMEAQVKIAELTGQTTIADPDSFVQMVSACLPPIDTETLQKKLYDLYRIEIPCMRWNNMPLIRVSIQGYNSKGDIEHLIQALTELL